MKKILIALALSFVITSCSGGTSELTFSAIEDPAFSMPIFDNWKNITEDTFVSYLPKGSYIVYESPMARDGVYSKLTILTESLSTPLSSLAFATKNIEDTPSLTLDYIQESVIESTISEEPTLIHVFRAKHSDLSPELLFIQAFVVIDGTQGYTLTFSTAPSNRSNQEILSTYIGLLQSFAIK